MWSRATTWGQNHRLLDSFTHEPGVVSNLKYNRADPTRPLRSRFTHTHHGSTVREARSFSGELANGKRNIIPENRTRKLIHNIERNSRLRGYSTVAAVEDEYQETILSLEESRYYTEEEAQETSLLGYLDQLPAYVKHSTDTTRLQQYLTTHISGSTIAVRVKKHEEGRTYDAEFKFTRGTGETVVTRVQGDNARSAKLTALRLLYADIISKGWLPVLSITPRQTDIDFALWNVLMKDQVYGTYGNYCDALPALAITEIPTDETSDEWKYEVRLEHPKYNISVSQNASHTSDFVQICENLAQQFSSLRAKALEHRYLDHQNHEYPKFEHLQTIKKIERLSKQMGMNGIIGFDFEVIPLKFSRPDRVKETYQLYKAVVLLDGQPLGLAQTWFTEDEARKLARLSAYMELCERHGFKKLPPDENDALTPVVNVKAQESPPGLPSTPDFPIRRGGSRSQRDEASTVTEANSGAVSIDDSRPVPLPVFSGLIDGACFTMAIQTLQLARKAGLPNISSVVAVDKRDKSRGELPKATAKRLRTLSALKKEKFLNSSTELALRDRLIQRSKLPMMAKLMRKELLNSLNSYDVLIIIGSTGSGKTTQVPQIILDNALKGSRGVFVNIFCTQPRRISATSIAKRVAFERNEPLQQSVGYHIRFTNRSPEHGGSIIYATTGILLRRLQEDPDEVMDSYSHIIIDEIHERSILIDFILTSLRNMIRLRRRQGMPVPKIVLMSATIESNIFHDYFSENRDSDSPLKIHKLEVPGRTFEVSTLFLDESLPTILEKYSEQPEIMSLLSEERHEFSTRKYLETETSLVFGKDGRPSQIHLGTETTPIVDPSTTSSFKTPNGLVVATLIHILTTSRTGDILIFLPGLADIDQVAAILQTHTFQNINFTNEDHVKIFKLHSALYETNEEVFKKVPKECRRIVLATNIAETSITLPEVVYVIDSGKVREMRYDQRQDANEFGFNWISKANVTQRKGRAGRVQNGYYYALYTRQRYESFQQATTPEILRSDLIETCLDVSVQQSTYGIGEFLSQAINPPSADSVKKAITKLKALGTLTEDEKLTPLGQLMGATPIHPAMTKAIVLGIIFRCLEPMLILASLDIDDPLITHPTDKAGVAHAKRVFAEASRSDIYASIEAFRQFDEIASQGDEAEILDLSSKYFINRHVYKEMLLVGRQIYETFAAYNVVPQLSKTGSIFQAIPPELNENSRNATLVKALAFSSISSRLAVWHRESRKTWRTKDGDSRGLMAPRSVNVPSKRGQATLQRRMRPSGTLMAYAVKKQHVGDKHCWLTETSLISPLTAILFSSRAELEADDTIKLDGWLSYRIAIAEDNLGIQALETAKIMIEFRKSLDRFLALSYSKFWMKMRGDTMKQDFGDPDTSDPPYAMTNELENTMVNGIIQILDADNELWEGKWKKFEDVKLKEDGEQDEEEQEPEVELSNGSPED